MYTITIETAFSAIHRVRMPDGTMEPPHGHDWQVRATFSAVELDDCDMVVDFQVAQMALKHAVTPLQYTDLNDHAAFRNRTPTAELIAEHIFRCLLSDGLDNLARVDVREAPGCVASYVRAGRPA